MVCWLHFHKAINSGKERRGEDVEVIILLEGLCFATPQLADPENPSAEITKNKSIGASGA